MAVSREYPELRFVQARWYKKGRSEEVTCCVFHHTAGAETATSAENGAQYDTWRDEKVSSHFYVDQNSAVQCVLTTDTAYTCMSGNSRSINFELCGTLQTREEWLDSASYATLRKAAWVAAKVMADYGIPLKKLTPAQVRAGSKGICGHGDVAEAFPEDGSTKTDPGPYFPWDILMGLIAEEMDDGMTPEEFKNIRIGASRPVGMGDAEGKDDSTFRMGDAIGWSVHTAEDIRETVHDLSTSITELKSTLAELRAEIAELTNRD